MKALKNLVFPFILLLFVCSCNNSNWPNFRGPDNNNISEQKNLPEQWDDSENIAWKYELEGRGWSSPVVWGNKIFFTNAVLKDPSILREPRPGRRPDNPFEAVYSFEVICLDLKTGKEDWKKVVYTGEPTYRTHRDNNYAPETMVTDGKNVYAQFGNTGVYCFDLDGNQVWEKELESYPMQGNWGTSTSPLLYKNKLYLQIDNEENSFLAALDKKTGEELWRVQRDEKSNWGTPIIWKNSYRTELVSPGLKLRGYNPENGEVIWELDLHGGRNISSPVADGDMLFIGNEKRRNGGGTLFGIKAGAEGDISLKEGEISNEFVAWSVPESGIAMASQLVYRGLVYVAFRNGGKISCFDAKTGKAVYQEKEIKDAASFWASPWASNDKIFCLDEKGITHVLKAGENFEELEKNKIDDIFWASTAIAKNAYIFRGEKAIYCIRK